MVGQEPVIFLAAEIEVVEPTLNLIRTRPASCGCFCMTATVNNCLLFSRASTLSLSLPAPSIVIVAQTQHRQSRHDRAALPAKLLPAAPLRLSSHNTARAHERSCRNIHRFEMAADMDIDFTRRNKKPRPLSEHEKEKLDEFVDAIHYSARCVVYSRPRRRAH